MVLLKKADYNTNITEIQNKIPYITGLITATLTTVENKIPNVGNLVQKSDHDVKILDIGSRYITTAYYNKFTKDIFDNKIKSKELIEKSALSGFISNADLDFKK